MSKNLQQVYTANPITTNQSTDLMYFARSPYGAGDDCGMTYASFSAQFGTPYTAAALTKTDDTNVTLTLGGTPATALLEATSITAGWTGTLSLARGGSAADLTASAGSVTYSTASAMAFTAVGSAGQVLTSNGTSAPSWTTPDTGVVWAANSNTSISAAVNNGYVLTSVSTTTVTLPTTFAVGQQIGIQGEGAAWVVDIGAATSVKGFGNTYTTSIASANNTDSVIFIGIVANTTWAMLTISTTGFTAS
jgi:hypothetical protein